jgi:hypothetical protein
MLLQYSRGQKKKKNDPSLIKKKRISPTHKIDNKAVDVDLGKEKGTQTCAHIKKTQIMIHSTKGVNAAKEHLKKKSINSSGVKERSA